MTRFSCIVAAVVAFAAASAHAQSFSLVDSFALEDGEGEILSYTTDMNLIAATSGTGARIFMLDGAGQVSDTGVSVSFGGFDEATSVALSDRGYGIVSLLPNGDTTAANGSVGFFNYKTGALLGTVEVGFHPDSVKISEDGNTLFVADEGEHGTNNVSGSISRIDLTGATAATDFGLLSASTFDFNNANVAPGAQAARDALRNNNPGAATLLALEPEFIAFRNDGNLLVSLQEANAIGVFDPTTNRWVAFQDLGTITQTIDASDKDGVDISDVVKGLPMPDAIATFEAEGQTFIVTANEGDFRPDDFDRQRVKDFDGAVDTNGDGIVVDTDDNELGRLRVSTIDSDPDGDNVLEDVVMPGTRSFSIWNADTGALVADSGSLEQFLLANDPLLHNINDADPGEFDKRSDDKGPEPEGIDVLVDESGNVFVAVGMERQNGLVLAQLDLSDVGNGNIGIDLLDYINDINRELLSPESLLWINAADSPTGDELLLVGYEGVGGGKGNAIGVYAIPEPTTALLSVGLTLGLVARRRRRAA